MFRKSVKKPKVTISSKGIISVDVEQLLQSPKVQKTIKRMAEIHRQSEAYQKSSESVNSTN